MKCPYWEGDLINLVKFNSNIDVIQLLGLAWHILPLPSAVFKTDTCTVRSRPLAMFSQCW